MGMALSDAWLSLFSCFIFWLLGCQAYLHLDSARMPVNTPRPIQPRQSLYIWWKGLHRSKRLHVDLERLTSWDPGGWLLKPQGDQLLPLKNHPVTLWEGMLDKKFRPAMGWPSSVYQTQLIAWPVAWRSKNLASWIIGEKAYHLCS